MRVEERDKRAEAVRRMVDSRCPGEQITEFLNGKIRIDLFGMGWSWARQDTLRKIHKLESEMNCLFYAGIKSGMGTGVMTAWLMVSDYPEEWDYEHQYSKNGTVYAWVENEDVPAYSECGSVGLVRNFNGILNRVW